MKLGKSLNKQITDQLNHRLRYDQLLSGLSLGDQVLSQLHWLFDNQLYRQHFRLHWQSYLQLRDLLVAWEQIE